MLLHIDEIGAALNLLQFTVLKLTRIMNENEKEIKDNLPLLSYTLLADFTGVIPETSVNCPAPATGDSLPVIRDLLYNEVGSLLLSATEVVKIKVYMRIYICIYECR
jgi:hypothetical protein